MHTPTRAHSHTHALMYWVHTHIGLRRSWHRCHIQSYVDPHTAQIEKYVYMCGKDARVVARAVDTESFPSI